MKYKVHRLEVDDASMQEKLENFVNGLEGEILSVIPHVARTSLSQIFGAGTKVDFLLILEKV